MFVEPQKGFEPLANGFKLIHPKDSKTVREVKVTKIILLQYWVVSKNISINI